MEQRKYRPRLIKPKKGAVVLPHTRGVLAIQSGKKQPWEGCKECRGHGILVSNGRGKGIGCFPACFVSYRAHGRKRYQIMLFRPFAQKVQVEIERYACQQCYSNETCVSLLVNRSGRSRGSKTKVFYRAACIGSAFLARSVEPCYWCSRGCRGSGEILVVNGKSLSCRPVNAESIVQPRQIFDKSTWLTELPCQKPPTLSNPVALELPSGSSVMLFHSKATVYAADE